MHPVLVDQRGAPQLALVVAVGGAAVVRLQVVGERESAALVRHRRADDPRVAIWSGK